MRRSTRWSSALDSRGSSVVVVDDDGRPVGRILADDVVDALVPDAARSASRAPAADRITGVRTAGRVDARSAVTAAAHAAASPHRARVSRSTWPSSGPGSSRPTPATTRAASPPTPRPGSEFVYRTLFVMVLVTVALVVVQEMAARLGAYTGEGLMSLIREQFSLRMARFAVVCAARRQPRAWSCRSSPASAPPSSSSACPATSRCHRRGGHLGVVVFGSYRYAERVFLLLSLVFLAYPIAVVLGHPDWTAGGVEHRCGRTSWPPRPSCCWRGAHRHHHHAVHAAVPGRGRGRPGHRPRGVPRRAGSTRSSARIFANLISMSIIIATARGHRRHRPADLRRRGGQGAGTGGRHGPRPCSASACSARPPWPRRWCPCRRPTRWPRRSAWSGRCPALPRGAAVPGPVHRADHHRRGRGADPGNLILLS